MTLRFSCLWFSCILKYGLFENFRVSNFLETRCIPRVKILRVLQLNLKIFNFQILSICDMRTYAILAIGNNEKKKKKEVLRHRACNAQRARARARWLIERRCKHRRFTCVHTHVLCTLVRSYDRCLEIYTLRHSDTAVPRKEFLAHARSMSVSVFWILIVSLRSRVRTIAMRRKGASTWSININRVLNINIEWSHLVLHRVNIFLLSALVYQIFYSPIAKKTCNSFHFDIFLNNHV